MAITFTITDPATIALLRNYRQYVGEVDQVPGVLALNDLAEGLVVSGLDDHWRFREWRQQQQTTREVRAA